jgi:hypothetical protein
LERDSYLTLVSIRELFASRESPKLELYNPTPEALDWEKPKTVGLRQDKSQDFLEFGLF